MPAAALRRTAERALLARYANLAGSPALHPGRVSLTGVSSVHVPGVTADRSLFVAVSTQVVALRPEELPEVAQLVFTLSLVRSVYPQARVVLLFAGDSAADSVRTWVRRVHGGCDIQVGAVDLDDDLSAQLRRLQLSRRQIGATGGSGR